MYGFFLFCFIVEVSSSKYLKRIQRNDSTESVNLTCQSARTVRLFCSNQFCPLCINTVVAIILLVTSNVATHSFTQHQRLRSSSNVELFMRRIKSFDLVHEKFDV